MHFSWRGWRFWLNIFLYQAAQNRSHLVECVDRTSHATSLPLLIHRFGKLMLRRPWRVYSNVLVLHRIAATLHLCQLLLHFHKELAMDFTVEKIRTHDMLVRNQFCQINWRFGNYGNLLMHGGSMASQENKNKPLPKKETTC